MVEQLRCNVWKVVLTESSLSTYNSDPMDDEEPN